MKERVPHGKIPLEWAGSNATSPPEWPFLSYFSTENPANVTLAGFSKNKAK